MLRFMLPIDALRPVGRPRGVALCTAALLALVVAVGPDGAGAQVTLSPEEKFAVARSAAADTATLGRATLMLDRIEAEHPGSDIAVLIRLYRDQGMDDARVVTTIDTRLAGAAGATPPPAADPPVAFVPIPGAPPAADPPVAFVPIPGAPPVAAIPPAPAVMIPGPASAVDEDALALTRADRVEVQGRLASAGFEPGGTDGSLGPRSRAAISAWQESRTIAATGFLSFEQLALLRVQTASSYATWLATRPPAQTRPRRTGGANVGAPGCSGSTTDARGQRRPECDLR